MTQRDRKSSGRLPAAAGAVACFAAGAFCFVAAWGSPTVHADFASDCAAPTVTFPDGATAPANLNLTNTDVVLFTGGTYTGNVNSNLGTICVNTSAVFDPGSINGTSRLFVRGSALMPPLAAGSGAVLDNEGTTTFQGQPNTNGVATITNRTTGVIILETGFALGAGATVLNNGSITVQGNMTDNGATITNNGDITIQGTWTAGGTTTNNGSLVVKGLLTINGSTSLVNTCSLSAGGLINNNSVINNGVIDLGTLALLNNSANAYTQGPDAITVGGDFTNPGSVTGAGQYLFSGTTTTNGSIAGDSAASPIVFEDTSPTGPIFDVQNGAVVNVVAGSVTPPPAGSCSVTPPTTTTTTTT